MATDPIPEDSVRWLDWDGCVNARDLGGLLTRAGRLTRDAALVRADSMDKLTPAGVAAVQSYGVSAFIDLRSDREASARTYPFETRRVRCPVQGGDGDAYGAESLFAMYVEMATTWPRRYAAAVRAVAAAPPGPVVVHCAGGKDRTGLVIALCLAVAGVEPGAIAADYALSGERLLEVHRQWMATIPDPDERARLRLLQPTRPQTMLDLLAMVEKSYAGAEAYLRRGGLTSREVSLLRERLVS